MLFILQVSILSEQMLNLGHIFVFWLRFIDYIAVSALKMLKTCLTLKGRESFRNDAM